MDTQHAKSHEDMVAGPVMLAMMGKQKAAVFPEPVWAQAIKSLPFRQMGMEYLWTGVGLVYLHFFTLAVRPGPKSTCEAQASS